MDIKMDKEVIRFYFSFNDPYSFIITPALTNLAHSYKVNIDYIPITGYDRAGMFSENDAISRYYKTDAMRFAKKADRKLIFDDAPQNSRNVCRARFLADENMLGLKYINLIFALRWVSGKDISKTKDVLEGLKFLEFNEQELVDALETDKYGKAQMEAEAVAIEDGVIGVPFFTFRGEGYLGEASLGYLEDILKSDQSLIIHHDASYAVVKADELAERIERKEPLLLLDVRIPKDFSSAHIPGANCLPSKIVRRNLGRMEREWNIVVIDDGGVEASETAFMMATEGFGNVTVLSGGIKSWTGETETGLENWQDKLKPIRCSINNNHV